MSQNYRVKDFIDNDLKVFSNLDNVRSIPSLVDGLKDAQRKAVFGLLKHGNEKIKVSQLGAFAGMVTHYNHGENSMCDTIVNLAQNFTGSNNVNLFEPIGQFGTILSSESSAHRYIYTKPSKYLRQYFLKEDDDILDYHEDEGTKLEPKYYLPLVPMWILNGTKGIGTGHASTILSRNPKLIGDLVTKLVKGINVQDKTIEAAMTPYFEGWKGRIEKREPLDDTKWDMYGIIEKVNTTTLRVTELPVSYDVDKFKGILIDLMEKGKIKDFNNSSTENGFDFEISVPREIGKKEISELIDIFKLKVGVGENVTLWDAEGRLKKYGSVYEALQEFIAFRLGKYTPRKETLLKQYEEESELLRAKYTFIDAWNNKIANPHKLNKQDLRVQVNNHGVHDRYIEQLLNIPVSSLTLEKCQELMKSIEKLNEKYKELKGKTTEEMYIEDLASI